MKIRQNSPLPSALPPAFGVRQSSAAFPTPPGSKRADNRFGAPDNVAGQLPSALPPGFGVRQSSAAFVTPPSSKRADNRFGAPDNVTGQLASALPPAFGVRQSSAALASLNIYHPPQRPQKTPRPIPFTGILFPSAFRSSVLGSPSSFGIRASGSSGFSLIEIIGIVAISLIIVLGIAWTTVKSTDVAYNNQEAANLTSFSSALQNSILRNGYIPGTNDWHSVIATEAGLNTNSVLVTTRNTQRVFMVDPNLQIGTNSNGVLPYSQTTSGSTNTPQSPRVMILSSLSVALPAGATSSTNFTALWNTTDGTLPSNNSFAGWKGHSDDLKIQRINLSPLFVHLQIPNSATNNFLSGANNYGQYKISGQGPIAVTNSVDAYFLQNTLLTLLPDTNSATATTPQAELLLSRDFSLFYVQRVWRDVPYVPDYFSAAQTNASAAGLANMIAIAAANFVVSPFNTNAIAGATPPVVLNAMSNFMYNYVPYASYAATNNWPTTGSLYTAAKSAQTNLAYVMNNLANPSSSGNMTPGGCTNAPGM